jgi:O6-methylguanine-DNA--protein-cysteine methyltransferase
MAGKGTPLIYCWPWRVGELRIYTASSAKGAFRVSLSLKEEGDACDFFRTRLIYGRLEANKAKNKGLFSALRAALQNQPVPSIPMDIYGTPFQWKAWKAASGIPFGTTKTYGQVAATMGKRGAARAVGQAMGRNPLPLVFP